MSQHSFVTTDQSNESVTVTVGFDRMTCAFFYNVRINGEVVRSSIEDPETDFDSEGLLRTLATQEIVVPMELMNQLTYEAVLGGSNMVQEWPSYTKTACDQAMLALGMVQNMQCMLPPDSVSQWVLFGKEDDQYAALQTPTVIALVPVRYLTEGQIKASNEMSNEALLQVFQDSSFIAKAKA